MSLDRAVSLPVEFENVLQIVLSKIIEYMKSNFDSSLPLHSICEPEELLKYFDDMIIQDEPMPLNFMVPIIQKVINTSVRVGHSKFHSQLASSLDPSAYIAEMITSVLNTNMFTYEVAPLFSLMEKYVIQEFGKKIGFNESEGAFCPGGSQSNLLAFLAARFFMIPQTNHAGILKMSKQLVAFASEHSHYSISRALSVLGIGTDNCILVDCKKNGTMDPTSLKENIQLQLSLGNTPFLVSASSGSTVFGSFDELEEISKICNEFKIWCHVDACWGGHVLLSEKRKHLMKGVCNCDSVSFCATKGLGIPQHCSFLITRHTKVLKQCNQMNGAAMYLFHEEYDQMPQSCEMKHPILQQILSNCNHDLGEYTLNCSRRVDVFKLWFSLKTYGWKGFESRVEHGYFMQNLCRQQIQECPWFKFVPGFEDPMYMNVCFWYVPKFMRKVENFEPDHYEILAQYTQHIRQTLFLEGKCLTNYANTSTFPHFFRHITSNPSSNWEDHKFLLEEIYRIGDCCVLNEKFHNLCII